MAKERLLQLKKKRLNGILASVNPSIFEYVAFERTERVIEASKEVFASNAIVYQEDFYHQFIRFNIKNTMVFGEYLLRIDIEGLRHA
ncbi:MAG: hypothetical protein ACUVQ8_01740 [Nitrososphaeria archaeon]